MVAEILGKFLLEKESRHPLTGQQLSKNKRIESMYKIVTNRIYGAHCSVGERILAADLIKKILEEELKQ